MRRAAAFLALLLFPAVCGAGPEPAWLTPETLANVVYVRTGDSTGTAFLLRHGNGRYLVTARHVIDAHLEDPSLPLEFRVGGKRGRVIRKVQLLGESRRADIAVYGFEDDPNVPYFDAGAGLVAHEEIHLASQVFLVGYPASLRQTYGSSQLRVVGGWVAGLRKYVPGSTVEYVDIDMAGVEHGHSGGPILLLQDKVVAVAVQRRTGSVTDTIGATYAVPIKYVTAVIDGEPVHEDARALDEALRGTSLICGIALHGKDDFDVWAQRIQGDTGEGVWGDLGLYVASSPANEPWFQVVPSEEGSVLVVHAAIYGANDDHDVLVQRLSRAGELMLERGLQSRPVAVSPIQERRPLAVSDGAGGALVVYEAHLPGGDVDLRGQRVGPDGDLLWDEQGVPVSTAKLQEREAVLVEDGAGGMIVVHEIRMTDGDVNVQAQRVHRDGTLAWHDGKRSAVVAAGELPEFSPRAVPDGEGGAIVVYELELKDGRRALLAQRISRHGALLWNGGERGVLVSSLPLAGDEAGVAVTPDGLGGAFVAFEILSDPAKPEDVDLAMQRIGSDGSLKWGKAKKEGETPPPVLAASSTWPERRPVLHSDGQGGVIIAFETGSEQGDLDVRAQRLDGDGRLRWHDGERSTEVALTFLSERNPTFCTRTGDRIVIVFEVERENGRGIVACQALSISTGKALYGGGRLPVAVIDPGDVEVNSYLRGRLPED